MSERKYPRSAIPILSDLPHFASLCNGSLQNFFSLVNERFCFEIIYTSVGEHRVLQQILQTLLTSPENQQDLEEESESTLSAIAGLTYLFFCQPDLPQNCCK